ncbi:MAG: DUF4097 family beta strand repeat-containing protein [Acholeplasmatales bacterium]
MKKGLKISIIVASILLVVGLGLFITVMAVNDFDFSQTISIKYVTETYSVNEDFENIRVEVETTKVIFEASEDEKTKVTCSETNKLTYDVGIKNNTLVISAVDNRRWFNTFSFFNFRKEAMTIYLPKDTYNSLTIKNQVGTITIPKNFTFEEVDFENGTGSVNLYAKVNNDIKIVVETGDIRLENITANNISLQSSTGKHILTNVSATNNINIKANTGSVILTSVRSKTLRVVADTGTVKLNDVISTDYWNIITTVGSVVLTNSDAGEIFIKTTTGSVKGSLLSSKIFMARSDVGKITVPRTTTGGICEIETDTGTINITISE